MRLYFATPSNDGKYLDLEAIEDASGALNARKLTPKAERDSAS